MQLQFHFVNRSKCRKTIIQLTMKVKTFFLCFKIELQQNTYNSILYKCTPATYLRQTKVLCANIVASFRASVQIFFFCCASSKRSSKQISYAQVVIKNECLSIFRTHARQQHLVCVRFFNDVTSRYLCH